MSVLGHTLKVLVAAGDLLDVLRTQPVLLLVLGELSADVARPAFAGVEGDNPDRTIVLAGVQVAEDGGAVSDPAVSLAPYAADLAEVILDEENGLGAGTSDGENIELLRRNRNSQCDGVGRLPEAAVTYRAGPHSLGPPTSND